MRWQWVKSANASGVSSFAMGSSSNAAGADAIAMGSSSQSQIIQLHRIRW